MVQGADQGPPGELARGALEDRGLRRSTLTPRDGGGTECHVTPPRHRQGMGTLAEDQALGAG